MTAEVPVLTFSGNEHSRSLLALDDNIELISFTDVAFDDRINPKATKSIFKTEVEENSPLTNCQLFRLEIRLTHKRKNPTAITI